MKRLLFKYILFSVIILLTLHGCYKDLGNYNYNTLPESIKIDPASYNTSYTIIIGDSLIIEPIIYYEGNISDLSFSWQMWNTDSSKYVTFQEGEKLKLKCGNQQGTDPLIPVAGAYPIRLAVANKLLAIDSANPNVNEIYSSGISLNVTDITYRGLMVLHGNGEECNVGLIENNMFLPKATDNVTPKVTSDFYSYFNSGAMIPGIGKRVIKYGQISTSGSYTYGTSNVYIFTDKTALRCDYIKMQNTPLDYSALFFNPSHASGNPQAFYQRGQAQGRTLIDNGRVFYGDFIGPLIIQGESNDASNYYAAPFAAHYGIARFSGGPSVGTVVYDTQRKSFLYSGYGSGTGYLYKFPSSSVPGVNLQPNNMRATLSYLELRGTGESTDSPSIYDALAVMTDDVTGERFLADFNFSLVDLSKVSVGRYSMENLPEADNIKYYSFGAALNLNYYATAKNIYQYFYLNSNSANKIFSFPGSEEITMMKIIKFEYSANSTSYYQFSNKMLVVCTVDSQNRGKLYAFKLDLITGALTLSGTFDGSESGGSRFGRIYDVDLKNQ